jgi:hypothetical protein
MPESTKRPFAYSVDKSGFVFGVRPTLALALEAARSRFAAPTAVIDITAWFADGTKEIVPYDSLCTADMTAWITSDDARQLENTLYPLATGPEPDREEIARQVALAREVMQRYAPAMRELAR